MIPLFSRAPRRGHFRNAFGCPTIVSALTILTLWNACAAEHAPRWNNLPVAASLQVAPLGRLERDLAVLFEGAGHDSGTVVRDVLRDAAAAVDGSRPAGLVILFDTSFFPIIFVPVKNVEPLLGFLHERFGWRFHRGDDGLYRGDALPIVARSTSRWIYFTGPDHRDHLATLPDDPLEIVVAIDPGALAEITVHAGEIPAEQREAFSTLVKSSFPETDDSGAVGAIVGHAINHLVTDSDVWHVALQFFRPLGQFHLMTRVTPKKGSELDQWATDASRRSMLMEHLAAPDAVAVAIVSAALDAKSLASIKEAWGALDMVARRQLPSVRSKDALERRMATLGVLALDTVKAAIDKGEFDAGMALHRQGDEIAVIAGTTLVGSRKIEDAASDLLQSLVGVPAFQALQWATGGNGDVTFHTFQVPPDENTRGLFGEAMHMTAAFGPDRLYAAIGGEASVEPLSLAIDRSRDEPPSRGSVVHAAVRVAPFMAMLDRVPGTDKDANETVKNLAGLILHDRKHDVVEVDMSLTDRELEGRLRIDTGVVRMVAAALESAGPESPAPPASRRMDADTNLALRVRPGDRFQLEFETESEATTTLDQGKRVETGVNTSLYEFRAVKTLPDAAVRLEATLKRVTITKKSPEGAWSFDSAAKPPKEWKPEMLLYGVMIDEPFQMTVSVDGSVDDFGGLAEAVDRIVDTKLQPPAAERAQAKAFVEGGFNAGGLRDSLGRAFEFYPGTRVAQGDRWTSVRENMSGIAFAINNKYLLKSMTAGEAVISVRGQIVQHEADPSAPIRWEVMGTQTGTIGVDATSGRLLRADYMLNLDAEATLEEAGKSVVRPVTSTIRMRIAPPAAAKKDSFQPKKRD